MSQENLKLITLGNVVFVCEALCAHNMFGVNVCLCSQPNESFQIASHCTSALPWRF